MNKIRDGTKWYNITEYVDIETGEMLKKVDIKKNYRIINHTNKIEINGIYRVNTRTNECRKHEQLQIEF